MEHDHGHHHSHTANRKTLTVSFIIITAYMLVEVVGGYLTKSLALLADAGHMLSDAVSLLIALMAFRFGARIADRGKTYGYKRFEILAAVFNGATLILISLYIFYEAIDRFQNPPDILSRGMLIISIIGLLVNALVAWIMMRGADVKENLNMRGAYLHVLSDMLGSVGAIIAALLIIFFGWAWADPLASVVVAVLVLRSGYLVTKSSLHVLMEGTPGNVDVQKVQEKILKAEGVLSIHDLHIWTITSGLNALTCHIVVDGNISVHDSSALQRKIEHDLQHENIHHITLQIESSEHSHDDALFCAVKAEAGHHHHHH